MNRRETSLVGANAAAAAQRARLRQRLAATTTRLQPARLLSDAEREVERRISQSADMAVDQVRAHPIVSGLGIAALVAWTFREPLLQHGPNKLRAAYDWLTGHPAFSNDQLNNDGVQETNDEPADDFPPPPPPPGELQD